MTEALPVGRELVPIPPDGAVPGEQDLRLAQGQGLWCRPQCEHGEGGWTGGEQGSRQRNGQCPPCAGARGLRVVLFGRSGFRLLEDDPRLADVAQPALRILLETPPYDPPNAQMSARLSTSMPRACSGLM